MRPKALVIGGTGFIGRHMTASLVQHGFDTHVVSRHTRPVDSTWIQTDRRHLGTLGLEKTRWACVIDNIAYTAADIEETLSVLSHAQLVILNSTISVYRYVQYPRLPYEEDAIDYNFRPLDEKPDNPHWSYARGKLEAERCLIQSRRPYAILRPTMVFGHHDVTQRTQWYIDRIKMEKPIHVNDAVFHLVSPGDVGSAVGLVAEEQARGVFNVAGDRLTLRRFVETLADALGKPAHAHNMNGEQGPYAFGQNWNVSTQRLCQLGWEATPWVEMLRELRTIADG